MGTLAKGQTQMYVVSVHETKLDWDIPETNEENNKDTTPKSKHAYKNSYKKKKEDEPTTFKPCLAY
jgi:hypothetical protein